MGSHSFNKNRIVIIWDYMACSSPRTCTSLTLSLLCVSQCFITSAKHLISF